MRTTRAHFYQTDSEETRIKSVLPDSSRPTQANRFFFLFGECVHVSAHVFGSVCTREAQLETHSM